MAVNFAENSSQMAKSRGNQTVKLAVATAGKQSAGSEKIMG